MLSITVIVEMQIKTTMSYYLTPVRITITSKTKVSVDDVEIGNLCTLLVGM